MKVTETYIDFGGTVYTFDQIKALPRTKDNAFLHYIAMTVKSWTYDSMTEKEKAAIRDALYYANAQGRIKGDFDARWDVMQLMYSVFLDGIGFDDIDWRENGVDCPRVIVEVDGGNVTNIYSDKPISVDVMDFDNLNAGDEYAEEVYKEFHAAKDLQRVY